MPGKPLPTIPQADVARHNTEKSCYVTIGSNVYDVTDFLEDHPGGPELILDHAGKDVTDIMQDVISHEHTDVAYEILRERIVGFMATEPILKAATNSSEPETIVPLPPTANGMKSLKKENNGAIEDVDANNAPLQPSLKDAEDPNMAFMASTRPGGRREFLDLEKPMLKQIWNSGFSKEFYLEQVHLPTYYKKDGKPASAPLFGNFLEPLSITPWYVVPLMWYPCLAMVTYKANEGLSSPVETAAYFLTGLALWTLVEYGMHRGLFHVDKYLPDNRIGITAHFLLHGIHHYLPMDRNRLVMPPALLVFLATPFYRLAHAVFSWDWYVGTAVFCGGFFGYIGYDLTHYFLHHKKLPKFYQSLKRYHMDHHYKDSENGFGVTSRFWDKVFGTELVVHSKAGKVN